MTDRLRISAKKLGRLAQPTFCPRCFWILTHMTCDTPYSVFPRIFTDLDVYTKRLVHGWFDDEGKAPPWLKALAELTGYIEPRLPAYGLSTTSRIADTMSTPSSSYGLSGPR